MADREQQVDDPAASLLSATPFRRGAVRAPAVLRPSSAGAARAAFDLRQSWSMAGYSLMAKKGRLGVEALHARALVLEDDDGHLVAFVVADLWSAGRFLHEAVAARTRVGDSGLDVHQIVLLGTHTHQAPGGVFGNSLWDRLAANCGGFHEDLALSFAGTLADAVEDAFRRRAPAKLTLGIEPLWCVSRNRSYAAFKANPEAASAWAAPGAPGHGGVGSIRQRAVDPRVVTLTAWGADGRRIGLLTTFACHNTAAGPRGEVYSADWTGRAAAQLEAQGVPVALVALSAAGDVTPLPPEEVDRKYDGPSGFGSAAQGQRLVRFVGDRVAGAALAGSPGPEGAEPVRLRTWYEDWSPRPQGEVAGAPGTTLGAWSIGCPAVGGAEDGRSTLHGGAFVEGNRRQGPGAPGDVQHPKKDVGAVGPWLAQATAVLRPSPVHPLHVVMVGSHVFATAPGEPTGMAGWVLAESVRRVTGARTASVLGYAGDYAGYFTTPAEYDQQHYEGAMTLYGRNTTLHLVARLGALAAGPPFVAPPREVAPFARGAAPVPRLPAAVVPSVLGPPVPSVGTDVWEDDGLHVVWWWEGAAPERAPRVHARGPGPVGGDEVRPERIEPADAPSLGLSGWRVWFAPDALPGDAPVHIACLPDAPFTADRVAYVPEGGPALEGVAPADVPGAAAAEGAPPEDPARVPGERDALAARDVLVRELRADPLGAGRALWAITHGPGAPSDAEALALAESALAELDPSTLEGPWTDPLVKPSYGHVLPKDFGFPGYDPAHILVDPNDWRFQEHADWWAYVSPPNVLAYEKFRDRYHPEPARRPSAYPSRFTYPLRAPTPGRPVEVALFADFANGLYMPRYIAAQLVADPALDAAIHLGDVYYAGREEEYRDFVDAPLGPLYPRIPLFALTGNHDMYGLGYTFHTWLDARRAVPGSVQVQEGHSWRLHNADTQIIGVDCQWDENRRISPGTWGWNLLAEWLLEGRRAGRLNILCTSSHGWDFGHAKVEALFGDLAPLVRDRGLVDLWFWGDVHHCALYDRSPATPFHASCIGHGGYPYRAIRAEDAARSVAPVLWAEYGGRFEGWSDALTGDPIRPDMGNNGWCRLVLDAAGGVGLRYVDWMGRLHHEVWFDRTRGPDGAVTGLVRR